MNRKSDLKFWLVFASFCLCLAPGLWAQSTQIGCGTLLSAKPTVKPASFVLVDDRMDPIVGLWKFTFEAGGNVIDAGYHTWHADGTELINSGRPPMSGSFCMGVWKRSGNSYRLNHWALSWDPTGQTLIGPANLHEAVSLGKESKTYSGTFTIDQYDTNGNLLGHAEGTVSGERITVD